MFKWENNLSEKDRVVKNVINLMSIKKNEVCFDRSLGVNINCIDKPIDKITSETITDMIDMIEQREPRSVISVEDMINFTQNDEYSMKVVINGA